MQSLAKLLCLCVVMCSVEVLGATLTVPAQYPTIQAAIDAADPNDGLDTIIVSPGTYYENLQFPGSDFVLTSTNPEDPYIVASTIIDGMNSGRAITMAGTETSNCKIRGFTITNGHASGEWSDYDGGGLYGNGAQVAIEYCTITGNTAFNHGGGLISCNGSITNCTISDNTARGGGGLYLCYSSISNCMIYSNTAASWGGGLYYCGGPITNCTISGNTASFFGGGLYNCDGLITNCTIIGNTAEGSGGGLTSCDGLITNCIIWGNIALDSGDQLEYSSTPTYSCIQNWNGGTGNINSDPLFMDTSSPDPSLWDLHLSPSSPCLDTGTNTPPDGLPATDIEGSPRPFDGNLDSSAVADMGAYEFHSFPENPYMHVTPSTFSFTAYEAGGNPEDQSISITNYGIQSLNWSIDSTSKPDWLTITPISGSLDFGQSENVTLSFDISGLSSGQFSYSFEVSDPAAQNSPQTVSLRIGPIYVPHNYSTIQDAINAVDPNEGLHTIIVSPGTYSENINFKGKDIILTSVDPTDLSIVKSTVIHGGYVGSTVTFRGTETASCTLEGFTITGGWSRYSGGGIRGNHSHAAVQNCYIKQNATGGDGGGIYGMDGSINNCMIANNSASDGGGLCGCYGWIRNCTILYNSTGYSGYGGGLYFCNGRIDNCTIAFNTARRGGGMYGFSGVNNCIIWGNTATYSYNQVFPSSAINNSCIQNWTGGGMGNISNDPLFSDNGFVDPNETPQDPSDDKFIQYCTLQSEYGRWDPNAFQWFYDEVTSPCIDAGAPEIISYWDPNGTPSDPNDDFFVEYPDPNTLWQNELWPHGGRINMGAYGGTPQASMSPNPIGNVVDVDHDEMVTLNDFSLFTRDWQVAEYLLDTDFDLNGVVDINDLMQLTDWWLWQQGPTLVVSERQFSPVGSETGPDPNSNILTISNTGEGILNWSIDATDLPEWLTITPTSGSLDQNESQNVTLSYDITNLPGGMYSYVFDIIDPAAMNSPQLVTVQLEIIGPILSVPQTSFSPVSYETGPNPDLDILTISNTGGGSLNWSIDLSGKPDWLTITPNSGSLAQNQSEPVTLSYDITGLSIGFYSYAFEVSDPMAAGSPQEIRVYLDIGGDVINVPGDVPSIQAAIDLVIRNGTIIVSPGTYYENLQFPGKDFVLTSTDPEDPDIVASTIIDGMNNSRVITLAGSETSSCQIRGFTITNGLATGTFPNYRGGGIYGYDPYANGMHAVIEYCTITGNTANEGGGLAFCDGSITNCTIYGNTANKGGGLYNCDGSITNCTITGNTAEGGGGLYYCDGAITNCTISGNTAFYSGGLYYCEGAITNCMISGNTGVYGGGLRRCDDGSITNCTIIGNTADYLGGGLLQCTAPITNCVIWGNSAVDLGDQLYNSSTPAYSCIQNWTGGGTGNITSNPLFVDISSSDPSLWDLHLLPGSPCIDTGTNTPPGGLPATDIEGNPRIIDGESNGSAVVDMGAYEYVP